MKRTLENELQATQQIRLNYLLMKRERAIIIKHNRQLGATYNV